MTEANEVVVNKAEQVLGELLNRALSGVDKAVEFSQAQIPEVVEQLLFWKMTESLIGFISGLILLLPLIYVWVKYSGKGELVEEGRYRRKWTLTHNHHGYFDGHFLCSILVSLLMLIFILDVLINFDWLQIIIAPKLYLLEYAANLVK